MGRAAHAPLGSWARTKTQGGPARVLVAVYAVFALAATARAGLQILTRFEEAPLAYLLSGFAGVVYIVATVALARPGRTAHWVAVVSCTMELVGVVLVGAVSLLYPEIFPDDTVWSRFGSGYLFLPLVLPILGLLWLRRSGRVASQP